MQAKRKRFKKRLRSIRISMPRESNRRISIFGNTKEISALRRGSIFNTTESSKPSVDTNKNSMKIEGVILEEEAKEPGTGDSKDIIKLARVTKEPLKLRIRPRLSLSKHPPDLTKRSKPVKVDHPHKKTTFNMNILDYFRDSDLLISKLHTYKVTKDM